MTGTDPTDLRPAILAEGGFQTLREMAGVLRAAGIDSELLRPPGRRGGG